MKNDTDLPQSVTILEHVQKPTKQRFFVYHLESRFCVTIPVKHLTDSGYSW